MNKELFFINEPDTFKPGIKIYPPTVKQVIANQDYSLFCKILTISQEDVEDEFLESKQEVEKYPTPLEFLLGNSYNNKAYEEKSRAAFEFFLHEEVTYLYDLKMIVIGNLEEIIKKSKSLDELVILKEEDFFDFQNAIRVCIGKKPIEPPVEDEHPKVKEIKRKARQRERLKAKKAAKSGEGISLYTMLVSICCMGIGITPLNIGEMSYTALESIFSMYQDKEKYQLDIDSLLAGADSKKIKPKYWISNFD